MDEQSHILRTALFVDFDNIYLGLKKLDEAAAERFATDPARWVAWMEQGMPRAKGENGEPLQQRKLLVRRCYLNPRDFYRYRPNFIRSAFNVIDCPSLTAQGKNSADIYMVMDIVDTLAHETHFDEFIILSGDADFTPVLLRLRSHDRRTVILAAGPASEAYKAACNLVIQEDVFIEYALGMTGEGEEGGLLHGPTAPDEVLDAMAAKLYAEASANGEILATDLPKLYLNFPEFRRDSNWLGFYSLRALTADLTRRHPALHITEGDPWRVTVRLPARAGKGKKAEAVAETSETKTVENESLRRRIMHLVKKMLKSADEPLLMSKVAHEIINKLGPQIVESRWAGAGTFKELLLGEDDPDLALATIGSTVYIYDPARHKPPTGAVKEAAEEVLPPGLEELIQRVHQATGTPDLTPQQYAVLFRAIVEDLKEQNYNLTRTSKSVRDRCIEQGESISRADVSFVLKGIIYKGHRFSKRDTPRGLAKIFRDSVLTRCEDVELDLSDEDKKLVDYWITGGLSNGRKRKK
ncbi:MAG: NYN domain-containing protein [Chloroflexi bacterium]|nr:NYN domain-containing protein [Chloroflexota bacterium]